jgi:hypothetical protein
MSRPDSVVRIFSAVIHPQDARHAVLLVTNPSVREDHAYELMHPLGVMARAHVGTRSLSLAHDRLLSGWIEPQTPVHHSLAAGSSHNSFAEELRELPGRVRIQTVRPDHTCRLSYGANGIVTLLWMAP